jgi:hypothetical protein
LRTSPPTDTEEGREFNDQLLYVFDVYRGELLRQVDGNSCTQDWLNVIAVTAMLASLLKDEFLEINPELTEYQPADEPMTIDEMILRLLSDAIDHFAKCSRSGALAPIRDLVQRVIDL